MVYTVIFPLAILLDKKRLPLSPLYLGYDRLDECVPNIFSFCWNDVVTYAGTSLLQMFLKGPEFYH